ncbi:MAG: tail needle knob protein [Plesiomonas shigelloides]
MAVEKPTPVSVEARRLDVSILPGNFSIPLKDFMVGQNDDIQSVADKANEAADSAYFANLNNEEQNVVLADHEVRITDHENRIDAAEITIANHEERIVSIEGRMDTAEDDIDALQVIAADHEARITANESSITDHETRIDALEYAVTRKKSELIFSGISLVIPTTPSNLITLLKALTPTSGTFAPFFDTVNDKMVVFNENKSVQFKLSMVGSWPGGTGNRAMTLEFSGSVPDTVVSDRTAITTTDNVLFATFFSVDQGGFMATNGSVMTVQSYGAAFTATTVKMIAEQ